jgi:hypothetical protein
MLYDMTPMSTTPASVSHSQHRARSRAHRSGCAALALSLLVAGIGLLYGVGVRSLLTWLWTQGLSIQGYALHGDSAGIAPLLLLSLGLLVGLVVTLRSRLWLGMTLLPIALALGFSVAVVPAGW